MPETEARRTLSSISLASYISLGTSELPLMLRYALSTLGLCRSGSDLGKSQDVAES